MRTTSGPLGSFAGWSVLGGSYHGPWDERTRLSVVGQPDRRGLRNVAEGFRSADVGTPFGIRTMLRWRSIGSPTPRPIVCWIGVKSPCVEVGRCVTARPLASSPLGRGRRPLMARLRPTRGRACCPSWPPHSSATPRERPAQLAGGHCGRSDSLRVPNSTRLAGGDPTLVQLTDDHLTIDDDSVVWHRDET